MIKTKEKRKCLSPHMILKNNLSKLIEEAPQFHNALPEDVPSKWEKHGDLVLLPATSFKDEMWTAFGEKLWDVVAISLKCKRVARKYSINDNDFRSPNVEILKGSDSWVLHIDNKIKYTYDITKCMFSAGNISEKLRIAQFSCDGETVVDLYAGIGYFTLPFLIHAKASLVHACEWNPHAVEALEKNLTLNGVRDKCVIHCGDNKKVCPLKIADRVNLGLIPSSEKGWDIACRALKPIGGILHIHGNVTSSLHSAQAKNLQEKCECSLKKPEWISWANDVCMRISQILEDLYQSDWTVNAINIIRIKSYAPHIDHLVADVHCKPSTIFSN